MQTSQLVADAILAGYPVTRCPPARGTAYSNTEILDALRRRLSPESGPRPRRGDIVIVAVLPRPYKRHCKDTGLPRRAFASWHYDQFRVGATLRDLRQRGVSKRAINRARAEGWLVVERVP